MAAYKTFVSEVSLFIDEPNSTWAYRLRRLRLLLSRACLTWQVKYLKYKYSVTKAALRSALVHKQFKKIKHEAAQRAWSTGGQETAYKMKYRFGNHQHQWFHNLFCEMSTMEVDVNRPEEESWEEDSDECGCVAMRRLGFYNQFPCECTSFTPPPPRETPRESLNYDVPNVPQAIVKPRSVHLLARLCEKIELLRLRRIGGSLIELPQNVKNKIFLRCVRRIVYKFSSDHNYARFEMDNGAHGEGDVSQVQTSNVVLTEQHGASIGIEQPTQFSARHVSSDIIASHKDLIERELVFGTFTWKSTHKQNEKLFSCELPRQFIASIDGTPNVIPFKFNRYMRGDMNIRLQVNTNPFMQGMLQMAWYYQAQSDRNFDLRDNIAGNSQTLHALINAGTSNEAILKIPYNNFKPLIECSQREDKDKALYLGYLVVRVLNPMGVTSTSANEATCTLFVSFSNTEFTGFISSDLNPLPNDKANFEMDVAAGIVASSLIESYIDRNRDNPTNSAQPTFFSPQVAQSWCYGNGVSESTFDLRLMRADVPHPSNYPDSNFTQKDVITRFGYVKTLEWKSSVAQGKLLVSFEAAPMVEPAFYFTQILNERELYTLPPVSYVANLFQYWRGSLKLRLDFIATKFHTGRLLIAYIPGEFKPNASLDQAKASTYVVFDLKESQQCNFLIPYVSDKLYWPRKIQIDDKGSELYSPGHVYIFVLNKLIPMDNIQNYVPFNVYIAGGEDMEFIIPAQPTIGLSWHSEYLPITKGDAKITNCEAFYFGTYTDLAINVREISFYPVIMRKSTTYGDLCQFWLSKQYDYTANPPVFYYLKSEKPVKVRTGFDPVVYSNVDLFIPWYDGNYIYALPCKSVDRAEVWCRDMIAHKGKFVEFVNPDYLRATFFGYPENDDSDPYTDNPVFNLIAVNPKARSDSFEIISSVASFEMDPRVDLEAPLLSGTGPSTSLGYGRSHLGESFSDFKDLCRRYQPYGFIQIDPKLTPPADGKVLFEFPVLPQGLELEIGDKAAPRYLWNKLREGLIPMLLAGYRFFRGSLRFRISLPPEFSTYFVQHIPFSNSVNRKIVPAKTSLLNSQDYFNHGYAYTVQSVVVNNVLSFEVPYYLNVDSMILQEPITDKKFLGTDLAYATSLGTIRVGLGTLRNIKKDIESKPLRFEILYALGDDARPATFQGFPPVIFTRDIPTAYYEMFSSIGKKFVPESVSTFAEKVNEINLNQVEEKALVTLDNLSSASSSMQGLCERLSKVTVSTQEGFTEFMQNLQNSSAPQILVNAFSHILQVLHNPTPVTMGIAIGSFLISIGIVSYSHLKNVVDLVTRIMSTFQSQHLNGKSVEATAEMDHQDAVSLASVLYAGVSTVLNTSYKKDSKFSKGLALDLMDGLNSGCKDGSYFFRFLSNILSSLVKCYDYIVSKLFPEKLGLENLFHDREIVMLWVEQCAWLLQPENESVFEVCPPMVHRVHSCYVLGSVIMSRISVAPHGVNTAVIKELYNRLVTLKTTLMDRGVGGMVRRQPFVIWMNGAPGLGKSHLSVSLALQIITAAGLQINSNPIYFHPAGAKYWENCNQEPVIVMDDAFVTRSGETNETEIQTFMALKSTCLFTPPIAECDRKKKRYAPEIVYVNSNNAFPELNNMESKNAIYRRRDSMWEVRLKPEYENMNQVPLHVMRTYDHLLFYRYLNPSSPTSNLALMGLTFAELRQSLQNEFQHYRNNQMLAYADTTALINASIQNVNMQPEWRVDPLLPIIKQYAEQNNFEDVKSFIPDAIKRVELENAAPLPLVAVGEMGVKDIYQKFSPIYSQVDNPILKFFLPYLPPLLSELEMKDFVQQLDKNEVVAFSAIYNLFFFNNCHISHILRDLGLITADVLTKIIKFHKQFLADWVEAKQVTSDWPFDHVLLRMLVMDILVRVGNPVAYKQQITMAIAYIKQQYSDCALLSYLQSELISIDKLVTEVEKEKLVILPSTSSTKIGDISERMANDKDIDAKPTMEEVKKISNTRPKHICDHHAQILYQKWIVKDIDFGKSLMGEDALKIDNVTKLKTAIDKILADKNNSLCRHFFCRGTYCVEYLCNCFADRTVENKVKHWCPKPDKSSCKNENCIMSPMPLFDEPCEKNCCCKSSVFAPLWRALMYKEYPGIVNNIASKPDDCPQLLQIRGWSERVSNYVSGVKNMFVQIWNFIKRMFDKLVGAVKYVFNFIKEYKYIFGIILLALGARHMWKNFKDSDKHFVTALHLTGDDIRGLYSFGKSCLTGAVSNAQSIFQSSRNLFVKHGTGDLSTLEQVEAEMISSGDPRVSNRQARADFKARAISNLKSINVNAKHQMAERDKIVFDRLVKNTVQLIAFYGESDPSNLTSVNSDTIRALCIGDRFCVTVLHAIEVFQSREYTRIGLFVRDRWISFPFEKLMYSTIHDSNLVVIRFPACVPQFKNILNWLATEADHNLRTPTQGTLFKLDVIVSEVQVPISVRAEPLLIGGISGAKPAIGEKLYSYPAHGQGVCGSLLMVNERNAPIYGMHIAGASDVSLGYAEPLFRETFEFLFTDLTSVSNPDDNIDEILKDPDTAKIDINSTIFPVGAVSAKFQHASSKVSAIIPSVIHGFVPPTTAPAPLDPKDPRLSEGASPLVEGCAKHGILTELFPSNVVSRVKERMKTFLLVNCKRIRNVSDPVLTDQQAVCGDLQLPFCDPLNWNSSEGYPFYSFRPKGVTDKKWLFNLEETSAGYRLKSFHPMLNDIMVFKRKERALGKRQVTIFTDCLKDARIPIEKVSIPGKTRIFSMSPVDYTIDFRKFLYDFIASFQCGRFKCHNMIGINVFSDEWDLLAKTLLRHVNICTGDYSNFGPGLNEEVAQICCELILDWYDFNWPDDSFANRATRKCLLDELIGAYHLCKDLVYTVGAGIPSGSPITVVLNSLVNIFYLYSAWDMMSEDWPLELQNFQNFDLNCVLFTYGDDFIMSVSDIYKDYFNSKTISECLAKFNIKLTDAFKTNEVTPYAALDKSTFLKGHFNFFDGRWWYGLEQSQIYDMCNWIRKSPNATAATIENADMALLHAQGHGKLFFDTFKSKLCRAFLREGIAFYGRSYTEIYRLKCSMTQDIDYLNKSNAFLRSIISLV